MQYAKFIVAALSLVCVALGLSVGLQNLGGQGLFTLIASATPLLLVALALASKRRFGRWMGAVSLIAFLIVGMKTSEAESLENVMVAAFFGMLVALVVLIRPER
jgi:hypothetical protein